MVARQSVVPSYWLWDDIYSSMWG